jgi:selenocysteine-specific elongation factor
VASQQNLAFSASPFFPLQNNIASFAKYGTIGGGNNKEDVSWEEDKVFVIGTAGHVDHGKSTLVEALTGIDPDRLQEEQDREMTIVLGFAWLTLPSGREVSIVDVPGHERFVKNMLSGVGGIDAALMVIAADEGVMPQTQEHLDILNLLEISRGVVAISKIDVVDDPEWLDLIMEEVREHLAGTHLEGAPLIPVSARTGQGLDELVTVLDELLRTAEPRADRGRPRLPIDRAFTISGFGTVVTGTLIDGVLRVGDEIEIAPRGLNGRIRGLQTHKQKVETAPPGRRTAVNLSGIGVEELDRGDVLAYPGWLQPTRRLAVRLHLLPSAIRSLRQDDALDFFVGAAERRVRVTLLEADEIPPGSTGWVLLRLRKPVATIRGDRFIVRWPSPGITIGGGTIVDAHPGRLRRFHSEVIASLEALERGRPEDILLQACRGRPRQARQLVEDSGLPNQETWDTLRQLCDKGDLVALMADDKEIGPATFLLPKREAEQLHEDILTMLREYHARYPLRSGMPKEELKSQLRLDGRVFNDVLAWAEKTGSLVVQGALVRQKGHRPTFTPEQQTQVDNLLGILRRNPFAAPPRQEWGIEPKVLDALVEEGRVVRLTPDVAFLPEIYEEMIETVLNRIDEDGSITVAQVRDLFQTSRKFSLALLEHMDQRKLTRRIENERIRYGTSGR